MGLCWGGGRLVNYNCVSTPKTHDGTKHHHHRKKNGYKEQVNKTFTHSLYINISSISPHKMKFLTSLTLLSLATSTNALAMADPTAARQDMSSGGPAKKFYGGAGIGRFSLDDATDWRCAYDMVLVERIQGKPKTESGLFVPQEDLPRLHLCRGEYYIVLFVAIFCCSLFV